MGIAAASELAWAADDAVIRRVVIFNSRQDYLEDAPGFLEALEQRGWIEGHNLAIDWRDAGSADMMDRIVREVVATRPDVIVAGGTALTRALQRATTKIPVVSSLADPVGGGFARSLARPGGNITGFGQSQEPAAAKLVELLKIASPRLTALTALYPARILTVRENARIFEEAAARAGLAYRLVVLEDEKDIEPAMRRAANGGRGAVVAMNFGSTTGKIAEAAVKYRLPAASIQRGGTCDELLLQYSLEFTDAGPRLAGVLDKILRGTSPADIPFEQAGRSVIVVNRSAAARIGLALPRELLLRADRVID